MSLEFEQKLPENVPEALPVYRLEEPAQFPASASRLAGLARAMGLDGKAAENRVSEDWTTHHEGVHELHYHQRSGAIRYRHGEKYQKDFERPFELDDEEAAAVGRRFAESTELVREGEAEVARVTHLRTGGGDPKGEGGEERVLDAGVVLRRSVENTPVHGPGGITLVNVDPERDVVGFHHVWRPVQHVAAEVQVLPPDVAYRAMEEVAGRVRGDVTVTSAGFGYFEQSHHDRQMFLQPAYALVYVVRDEEFAYKSAEVVSASEKVFEPLLGHKRFPGRVGEPRQPERGAGGGR